MIEVKCPTTTKTVRRYVTETGAVAVKVQAQLQLQMIAAGAERGILCVADPLFKSNGEITVIKISITVIVIA